MNPVRIVFPEYQNQIVSEAIQKAKQFYPKDFIPVEAKNLEDACAKILSNQADCMIAGIDYFSREVILSSLNLIGRKDPATKTFSASFYLKRNNEEYVLGDVAACKHPNEQMLYDLTLQTYDTAKKVLKTTPRVAMLSFSTLGSGGEDESITRIKTVINRIKTDFPEIAIDGELQLDAAINPVIGNKKAPGSTVAGRANTLITPDLNSGNLLYKSMEQFGNFISAGPILQGFKVPISDLSRGSTVEDVVSSIEVELKMVKSLRKN